VATLTPRQLHVSLLKAGAAAPRINTAAIQGVAAAAIPLIEGSWPAATGLSQDGWDDVAAPMGARVVNPVPYASDVHDGLADTLVPSVLAELEQGWEDTVNKQLLPIFEGR
jgi:hypothetical protein